VVSQEDRTLEAVSDELHKELAALAAKLGVSVERLWGVLVRQAYIDGLSSLVTVFCCAAAGLGVLWFFFYLRRKYKLTAEPKERFFLSTEPVEYMALGIILVVLVAVAGNNFYWVISDFFNPEFYALRHLPFSPQ
jgi:hypothetical protein